MYDDGVAGGWMCVVVFFVERIFVLVIFVLFHSCTNKEGLDSRGNMSRRPKQNWMGGKTNLYILICEVFVHL